jgi:hypothetical protein
VNSKKAKLIRKIMKNELLKGSGYKTIYHPFKFINSFNEACVRYKPQYITDGGKQLVRLAKKIYKVSGILPRG